VYQRLSTGQRINRASDDAAGLSIADALTAKSRVFTRGAQNVSDGLSALTIADSAVETLIQLTTRIQELAEQGANGSYSNRQRAALDKEAQSLRDEFLRIVQSTAFNGQRLLDGTVQGLQIQAGYGAAGAINSSVGGKLGTGEFNALASVAVGDSPGAIATADLNGDGIQDIVTANNSDDTVSVLLGDGSGAFTTKATMLVGNNPLSIALSDFNGDGKHDLVTANSSDDTVAVFLGNGDGTFASGSTFVVGDAPSAVAASDLNGDGIQDLVAANRGSDSISVLLGNGNGTFKSQSTFGVGVGASQSAVAIADFNNDGIPDIVTGNGLDASATVSVLLGNGNGTFQGQVEYSVGGQSSAAVVVGDFNGDGRQDIASVSDNVDGLASILLNNGNGTFASSKPLFSGGGSIDTTDFNGDGILDLVSTGDGFVTLNEGRGNGTFKDPTFLPVGSGSFGVAFTDFNGDGVPDIVAGGASEVFLLSALTRDGIQPLLPISLQTQADSKEALSIVSKKLELLSAQRGIIGAAQSRLLSGSRTLLSQRDEFVSANSRIRDTDFAGEAAELTRTQIVQNTATAVLAQANLQPAIALQLLRS
jgi:flagellin-like hook-associated protein FlgL